MEKWREMYDDLVACTRQPTDCSVAELFELASCLAVSGDFAAKKRVYADMIFIHPEASASDKSRVLIYLADLVRREGHAAPALALLERIGRPEEGTALLDWLQAMGQCLVMQGRYQAAIVCQRELLCLLDHTIPVDLHVYYMQTLAHLKLLAGEADEEVGNLLGLMAALLDQLSFPPGKLSYTRQNRLNLLARWHGENGDCQAAVAALREAYEIQVSAREQTVTVLLLLYYLLMEDNAESLPNWFPDLLDFYREQRSQLQPTDVVQYRKYYDRLEQYLAEYPA